ncbi:MAG: AsmA-like C-terminal region-containing protein, partial [Rickettsiales bacterium]
KKTSAAIIVLGKTKIKDGNISYKDMLTGKSYNAKNVNLDIQMPSIDSSLNIDAELTLNNEHASFSLHADQPLQLMEDGSSKITTNINIGSLLTLEFAGNATMQNANGNIDINIPSLIALSNWTGKKLDWNGDTSLALDIKGIISCTISDCSFNKAKIILDDNVLSGNMKINFANKIPVIEAKLTTDRFDINPYLAKNVKQASNSLSIISSAQAAQTQGWDTTPINLSGLRSINANLSLNAKELLYKNTILSKMALNLKLSNGSLALDIPYIELYDGTAKISATANASNAISATFNASKIQIEPLLKDFTQSDRLTGLANMNISITGNGASQRDIVSSLAGKGDVKINDGMFKGVDIAKVISTARDMVTGSDTYSEETKFSELGGTFTIAQGIIKNDDLMMKAPLLRLKGAGTVDLPRRYVNYRLIPSVVATLQGQGGKSKNGLDIPVIVEGSFEKLKFTPDLGSIIEETLKDPQKIKDTVKDIKDSVKKSGGLKNLLKGFK